MASKSFVTDTLRPLTGPLDCRSSPDTVPANSFRWLLNMSVTPDNRRARRAGWQKLDFGPAAFLNQDLHDQRDCWAVTMEGSNFVREPVTLLFAAESTSQSRKLYAATNSRIYLQSGNEWRVIGRGYGGTTTAYRFQCAQLGNTLLFTNGVDAPVQHTFGNFSDPCNWTASVATVPELQNNPTAGVGLDSAKIVRSFNGCFFLMNTVERGVAYPSRIRFSGFNNPTRWLAGSDTIAGFQDLPYNEAITGAVELFNTLLVFTNKSIYKCLFDGSSFTFERIYVEPRAGAGLLAYPNSLVSDGDTAWWVGDDAVYKYNIFVTGPVRDETVHRASKQMFTELDSGCCTELVAGFNPVTKEIWWSYPKSGSGCANSRTFIYNTASQAADYLDHGFTAFSNFVPDTRQTLDQWLDEYCGDGDLNSLCAALGGRMVEDFCGGCETRATYLGASAQDYCIKDIGLVFYRERCTNPTEAGTFNDAGAYVPSTGEYSEDGYFSIMRGIFPFGNMEKEKVIKNLLLDKQVLPAFGESCYLRLRVGTGYSALDPNPSANPDAIGYNSDTKIPADFRVAGDTCEVIWRTTADQDLLCPETRTNTSSLLANTRPDLGTEWPVFEEGRFLFWEIAVVGKSGTNYIEPIGGDARFNRIEVQARLKPAQV